MDKGARLWLVKTARKSYWRVSQMYDLDDLIQEGYAAYYDSVRRYPDVTDPAHRMALFKRVFMSRLHDMANKRTRDPSQTCFSDLEIAPHQESFLDTIAAEPGLEVMRVDLSTAPQYVRDAMVLLGREPDLMRLRSRYRRSTNGRSWQRRETLNERLCRLTGYPEQTDIVGGIRRALGFESAQRVTYHQVRDAPVVEHRSNGWFIRESRAGGGMMASVGS